MKKNNLDLLIVNFDRSTLDESTQLFHYIFKYNYKVKILNTAESLIDVDQIIKVVKSNIPNLLCFNIINKSLNVLPAVIAISNHIAININGVLTIAYGITPVDLRDVKKKYARFDFLCINKKSILDILNLIGDKEVPCQFEAVWFREGGEFRIE